MSLLLEERESDSPLVATLAQGRTLSDGSTSRPAESHWHLVLVTYQGRTKTIITGPQKSPGVALWKKDAEILWVKFKPGTFIPHLSFKTLVDKETTLPDASSRSFWLNGSAWQIPDVKHVDVFLDRLEREELLVRDALVSDVLQNQVQDVAPRTLRHRFLQATGMSKNDFQQIERAQQAELLLRQGTSISDTVYTLGFFDQPHLTRALKRWVGHTPAQLIASK
jgi:AraC-like DNA-binding protein